MTVKKIYIADDGTEFTSETECKEYEARQQDPLKDFRHKIIVLTSPDDRKPLDPTEYNNADQYIVIIVTEELTYSEQEILSVFLQFEGKVPDNIQTGKGVYIWDYNNDRYSFIPFKLMEAFRNNPIFNQKGKG